MRTTSFATCITLTVVASALIWELSFTHYGEVPLHSGRAFQSLRKTRQHVNFRYSFPTRLPLLVRCIKDSALKKRVSNFDDLSGAFGAAFPEYRSVISETSFRGDELEASLEKGFKIIDVRPKKEVSRVRPQGSFAIEFEQVQEDGRLKSLMARNPEFVKKVRKKNLLKDTKLIVACGDGPISLIACKQLQDAGYSNVHWLAGGLANVPLGVLVNEGDVPSAGYASTLGKGARFAGDIIKGARDVSGKVVEEAKKIDLNQIRDASLDLSQKALSEIEKTDVQGVKDEINEISRKALEEIKKVDIDLLKKEAGQATEKAQEISKRAWEKIKRIREDQDKRD